MEVAKDIANCLQGICLKEVTDSELRIYKILENLGVVETEGEEDKITLKGNKTMELNELKNKITASVIYQDGCYYKIDKYGSHYYWTSSGWKASEYIPGLKKAA